LAVDGVQMRMRTIALTAALFASGALAAPAQAKLVYVTGSGTPNSTVFVAGNTGENPRRVGMGRAPTISPDGRWVAFITAATGASGKETVVVQRLRSGLQRLVMRAKSIDALRFSPDSAKLGAVADGERLRVYDLAAGRLHLAARGHLRGYSFSPDSTQVVVGDAATDEFQARSDLHVGPALGGSPLQRLTRLRNAVNPVWGPGEIVFDRFRRRPEDAPAYNLWAIDPAAKDSLRRLTRLNIPPLASGLVPLEVSADARRMLAMFTGQDTEVGFTVATGTGRTRALSLDFEGGVVGFDLSSDGRTILGHTGGGDPQAAHSVVVVPWGRKGEPKVLVENAAFPDWSL
jgi:hypothetical protein